VLVCVVCVVCFTYVVIEACNVQGAHLFLCFFSSVMCVALCVCVLYVSCVCRASVVRLSCVCRASVVRVRVCVCSWWPHQYLAEYVDQLRCFI
jgi:hypothetical protein